MAFRLSNGVGRPSWRCR